MAIIFILPDYNLYPNLLYTYMVIILILTGYNHNPNLITDSYFSLSIVDISPCSSVSCSHFCLPSPVYNRICACPDHLALSDDLKNCIIKTGKAK